MLSDKFMKKNNIAYLGGNHWLTIDECHEIARNNKEAALSSEAPEKMEKAKNVLGDLVNNKTPIYGINTQFGSQVNLLENSLAGNDESSYFKALTERQNNLIKSHDCGLGKKVSQEIVRAAMALRAHCISLGHSGARPVVAEALINFLNKKIHPTVYIYGSIGASGDLIPLSAIAAALIGEKKEVCFDGKKMDVSEALKVTGLSQIELQAKEGLCLINGTSFMSGVAALSARDLDRIFYQMLRAVAMSLESLLVIDSPYYPLVHKLKHHQGEIEVNDFLLDFWKGSKLIRKYKEVEKENIDGLTRKENSESSRPIKTLQDYYSLRAVPQGFGPMKENLSKTAKWIENEMNSVNDNPIIDVEEKTIYNGANFMGYYITESCDLLKMDIAQASTWIHAILANLINPRKNFGLPANLIECPETYNAFRPLQILAAALAVQNRKLALNHQAFMLPTEGDNQDVNSLATHAAFDLRESVKNLERLTAILFFAAVQALELRGVSNASSKAVSIHEIIRKKVPFVSEDRQFREDIKAIISLMKKEEI